MRSVSEAVAILLIVGVTVVALGVAMPIIINYIKTVQPKGEVIDMSLVARKYMPAGSSTGSIEVTVYITCTGPMCTQYRVSSIMLTGYARRSATSYNLYKGTPSTYLSSGTIKIPIVAYYDPSWSIDEVVVSVNICSPSTCTQLYKSASLG